MTVVPVAPRPECDFSEIREGFDGMNFLKLRYSCPSPPCFASGTPMISRRASVIGLMLLSLAAFTSPNAGAQEDRTKQISELEKQLAELQAKLKKIKEAPVPKKLAPGEEIIPADWVNKFAWRTIGPATMGGRITGLAVYEADPTTYWVATATGGLLKTVNNGISFEIQFNREATNSIGAVAVAPSNKEIVWVGTGENNPRNSVSWGDGVYKSVDGGKTWANMGLKTSFQIGAIVVHPKNPDIVFVGALGRLYGPGGARGLFKTEDGGKTWKNVLPQLDANTGVIDIVMSPHAPDTLIVAAWERQRDAFDSFRGDAKAPAAADGYAPSKGHGPGSALYKTTDGGKTFAKLTKGLPTVNLGRIGLDWSRKSPNTVFAIIDSENAGKGVPPTNSYMGLQGTSKDEGAFISAVTENAPAAKAGLLANDIVQSMDGIEIKRYEEFVGMFSARKPGEKVKLGILRGKDKKVIEVTLGLRPDVQKDRPTIGITPEESEGGLKLTDLVENGPASKANLQVGDVINTIDTKAIKTRREMLEILTTKNMGDKITIGYTRGTDKKTVVVTLDLATGSSPNRPFSGQLGGNRENVQYQQGPDGFQSGGLFKSIDGGDSWTRVNSINPRPFYFSTIRIDPTDDQIIYVLGVSIARSTDGGRTFTADKINNGVHADQHALWINPKDSRHIIVGSDGGFYVSYDKCATWDHMNHAGALGQFYHVAVDNRKPYRVYGGLQDNGSWGGPSMSVRGAGPINEDWDFVNGGDGFVCRVDPNDPDIIYAESQDGALMRRDQKTGTAVSLRPRSPAGVTVPFRFNWNTPFLVSSHNSMIYYAAGNYVFKSVKQGEDLQSASPEITLTKRGSATALSESPKNADVLWVGTDDGAVWITKDGCRTWTNVTDKFKAAGLPGPRWVSSIEASRWAEGRAYVVFDGHRSDDEAPYVFVTEDFGATWKSINANLPVGSTRVCREDTVNPNLLYLGTEFAAYASINRGAAWTKINGATGLPTVAVHEFAQPTTANDLVVATHGRSVWVLDVAALRQITPELIKGKTSLMVPGTAVQWKPSIAATPYSSSSRHYSGQNPPRAGHIDYTIFGTPEKVELKILDVTGKSIRDLSPGKTMGYHRIAWDFSRVAPNAPQPKEGGGGRRFGPGRFVAPGLYKVVLIVDGQEYSQTIQVEGDPTAPKSQFGAIDEPAEERRLWKMLKNMPWVVGDN